jgi:maleate cis-trans isomerase
MKTIGLISPNLSEETLEDVYKILPRDIRIEGRPLQVATYIDSEFEKAEQTFAELVRDLTRRPLDFLMVTGELFLSYKGPGSDRLILELVKRITPVAASTVLTAVIRALRQLNMRRVVMASPFPEDQDVRLSKFLAHDGIEVVAHRCLGYNNSKVIWSLLPETGYELAAALLREQPDVDGVYMPCNKWRITSAIDRIEKDFNKPVVTNTQAWIWEALRAMQTGKAIPGFGRLLSNLARDS